MPTQPRRNPRRTPAGRPSAAARQKTNAELAERDEEIWRLRLEGLSLRAIGQAVGLSHVSVLDILKKGYEERIYPQIDEARTVELERLDELLSRAWAIMDDRHALVSHGRIIQDLDGRTLPDTGPVLAAMDRVLRIADRRARLLGLDAATKVEAQVFAPETEEVARLAAEAARRVAGE